MDGRGDDRHHHAGGRGQPAQYFCRRHMPVGHRAEHERRNEGGDGRGRERERLDDVQPVGIQNRAQRHKPNAHCRRLDEK